MKTEKIIYINQLGENIEFSLVSDFLLQTVEGLTGLQNDIHSTKTVNQDGASVVGSSLKERNITIKGTILKNRDKNKADLIRRVNPKIPGVLVHEVNGRKRKIDCEVEQSPSINRRTYPEFFISLLCPDPYFEDCEQDSVDLVSWIENLEFTEEGFSTEQSPNYWLGTEEGSVGFEEFMSEFGLGQAKTFGYRELRQIIEIDNKGDADTPIKVIFRADGDVVNPFIQNIESYDKIQIKGTLRAGDELIITTGYGDKNVYLNGVKAQQYYNFLESTWLQLSPGVNLIKYDAESGINNLECRILYTSKYLGV